MINNIAIKKNDFTCTLGPFEVEAVVIEEDGKEYYLEKYQVFGENNKVIKDSDITGRQIIRAYEIYRETQDMYCGALEGIYCGGC